MDLLAESAPPSGGAAFDEILIAMVLVTVVYLPLGWFLLRERGGHATVLGRLADATGRKTGLPRWSALSMPLAVLSLITAAFGVYWDVPIHMQNGRDEGPLANPSHYPILFGILGFLAAGVISAGLAKDPLPRRTVSFSRTWQVPMGAMVLLGAGLIAAVGFPADDLWHRLFGQDVTEWGPTHVMMIGGAVTCSLGVLLLLAESHQVGWRPSGPPLLLGRLAQVGLGLAGRILPPVRREAPAPKVQDQVAWATRVLLTITIGLCIIPMAFLMEFDLGVPQFPAATLFIISGFLTAWIFVAGRLFFGPGGALVTWLTYLVIRLLILVITLPVPDITRARWLLFIGAALAIEGLALVVRSRGPVFAGTAGVLAGVVGMAVDWWWMGVFMPYPLPPETSQMPLLLGLAAVAGLAGGLLGWSFAHHLERSAGLPAASRPERVTADDRGRWFGTTGVAIWVVLMGLFGVPSAQGVTEAQKECGERGCRTTYEAQDDEVLFGRVSYADDCIGQDRCQSVVTVTTDPVDATDDAVWFSAIAYQGNQEDDESVPGNGIVTTAMESTGQPGEFRTEEPLPLYGRWKVLVRLHLAPTTMVAMPIHMPEDTAIDGDAAGLVRAEDGDAVPFVHEPYLLQRERKDGVPVWLWSVMYSAVILSWLALLAFFGWCYAGAARGAGRPARRGRDLVESPSS
ncbi:ABC transporter permease [Nocardioides pelophilus]|uniref:ABC transporter permease n=1 Tax=Nocardioides pelophilus TaxID=2172019 RepID=UPI0016013A27|nr:ABC transporter permease [Nocardioides pelophilus]